MLRMLDLLTWILWFTLGTYSLWFFTKAKTSEPLTLDELVILWKLHKRETGCKVPISKLQPIVNSKAHEFLGFKCKCGYQYLSKRPIAQRSIRELSMFDYFIRKDSDLANLPLDWKSQ